jgi:hypothetical protein
MKMKPMVPWAERIYDEVRHAAEWNLGMQTVRSDDLRKLFWAWYDAQPKPKKRTPLGQAARDASE